MFTLSEMSTGHPQGQRLDYRYAKILLVRGQHKRFCGPECAPLQVALNHARPSHAICRTEFARQALHPLAIGVIDRAGHDQMEVGVCLRESAQQQIAPFFLMHPAEEEQQPLPGQRRKLFPESRQRCLHIAGGAVMPKPMTSSRQR